MSTLYLKLQNIKKSFGGVHALKGVDLEIHTGEIHCLAGENGCGKSTLIKIISGAHPATDGELFIEDRRINSLSPIDAIKMGIQVIYQDFAIFPNLTVAENIAMNSALMRGKKTMNWKEAKQMAIEAMKQIGADMDPDMHVERLTVANKQMVAICRAIINDAKLLILDEPTTALTQKEVGKLNAIIRRLKDKGMAIVIVNHKLDEIYEIADKLTILRNGENVASGNIDEFDRDRFVKCLTGRSVNYDKYVPEIKPNELLRVENLTKRGAFENVNFTLKEGEILGITGLLGSGRSEIGDAIFGVSPAEKGDIFLKNKKVTIRSIKDAMKNNIAYVPEDRLTQGLFMECTIEENTVAASITQYFERWKLNSKKMFEATEQWIEKIGCNAPSPKPLIRTLSGGNAQKIVMAKWLNTSPELLILNGPTVGVDVGAKADIHKILRDLAKSGVGIIIISDDINELVENCSSIIVLTQGRASEPIDSQNISETELSKLLTGAERNGA